MWVSQAEIVSAYFDGTDVRALYRRRVRIAFAVGAILAFFVAYAVKSALGIDLFSFHLWDLI